MSELYSDAESVNAENSNQNPVMDQNKRPPAENTKQSKFTASISVTPAVSVNKSTFGNSVTDQQNTPMMHQNRITVLLNNNNGITTPSTDNNQCGLNKPTNEAQDVKHVAQKGKQMNLHQVYVGADETNKPTIVSADRTDLAGSFHRSGSFAKKSNVGNNKQPVFDAVTRRGSRKDDQENSNYGDQYLESDQKYMTSHSQGITSPNYTNKTDDFINEKQQMGQISSPGSSNKTSVEDNSLEPTKLSHDGKNMNVNTLAVDQSDPAMYNATNSKMALHDSSLPSNTQNDERKFADGPKENSQNFSGKSLPYDAYNRQPTKNEELALSKGPISGEPLQGDVLSHNEQPTKTEVLTLNKGIISGETLQGDVLSTYDRLPTKTEFNKGIISEESLQDDVLSCYNRQPTENEVPTLRKGLISGETLQGDVLSTYNRQPTENEESTLSKGFIFGESLTQDVLPNFNRQPTKNEIYALSKPPEENGIPQRNEAAQNGEYSRNGTSKNEVSAHGLHQLRPSTDCVFPRTELRDGQKSSDVIQFSVGQEAKSDSTEFGAVQNEISLRPNGVSNTNGSYSPGGLHQPSDIRPNNIERNSFYPSNGEIQGPEANSIKSYEPPRGVATGEVSEHNRSSYLSSPPSAIQPEEIQKINSENTNSDTAQEKSHQNGFPIHNMPSSPQGGLSNPNDVVKNEVNGLSGPEVIRPQVVQKPGIGCAESGVFSKSKQSENRTVVSAKTPVCGQLQSAKPGVATSCVKPFVPPMSSMEEENLRERLHASLLRQCGENVHQEPRYNKDTFKRLFQSKEFLEQLFRLFDQDRDSQLHQDNWIEFLKERLSDEKQIDFAEQIESVAYVLCGENPITLEHFNQIFHAKGIVDKLFRLVDQSNVGTVSAEQVMEFVSNITNTRPRTGFDKKSLESLEQLFRQTVGNEKEIRREDFQKIVISKNPFFTERVFQIFDKDNSGSISLQEFLDSMHQFAGQSPDDKIKFLFKIYDIDGDGLIQHRELQHVMRACMEENGMQFSEEQIDDLTVAMFEDADTNQRGAITYEALKNQLEKHGGLLENLSISIDRWLVPPKPKAPPASFLGKLIALRPYQLSRPYLKNNYVYLIFLAAFIVLNLGLFVSRAFQYRNYHGYVIVARACGQCLNFNCMFILVLMLRQCITFLRTRGFSAVLPLDNHIYLHKMTGMLLTFFSVLHTLTHLLNFSLIVVNDPKINSGNYTLNEWFFTAKPGLFGLINGVANPTGFALFIILIIMFICSQAFVRRGGSFEVFYWTHLLYIPFWVLLIFHGPNFWKWFVVPGLVYLIERLLRLAWMRSERGKTYISSGLLLPSKVTHLVIKKPLHFDFHPGDYVFVNIPAIAKYEWHPFTVSSAPEQDDYMWLHIRAVGEWTSRLYCYFEKEQEKLHNGEIPPLLPGGSSPRALPAITNDTNTLKRLQASLKRKFSNRDPNRNKGDAQLVRYTHDRFSTDGVPHVSASDGEINNRACSSHEALNYPVLPKSISPEKRLQMLLFHQKVPLEKSLSMPDIQTKAKKRERLLVLREYMRSESEKSFDECQIRRARLQSLGLAYLSPQNKSLAQSFRYMRHKPTIIAFKTPSLENCEQRNSNSSLGSVGRQTSTGSFASSPERQAEEGRLVPLNELLSPAATSLKPVNYPVGKPLEPIPEDRTIIEIVDLEELIPVKHLLGSGTEVTLSVGVFMLCDFEKLRHIFLDGPYGAPSSHIFRAQHAVLIATGIGVTPFASILQSIMHRYWKARHCCPKCKFSWASEIPATVMNLRKVDFFWINRDQRSFEWFVNLLSQLEIEQAELGGAMERFLEMHMYITSALQKTDMKAVGLQLALDLLHEKEKRDLITGLKTRTNAGRPNWDKVFKQLQDQKKGKITVFYCGPPQLGRILRYKCDQYGFSFRKETF